MSLAVPAAVAAVVVVVAGEDVPLCGVSFLQHAEAVRRETARLKGVEEMQQKIRHAEAEAERRQETVRV